MPRTNEVLGGYAVFSPPLGPGATTNKRREAAVGLNAKHVHLKFHRAAYDLRGTSNCANAQGPGLQRARAINRPGLRPDGPSFAWPKTAFIPVKLRLISSTQGMSCDVSMAKLRCEWMNRASAGGLLVRPNRHARCSVFSAEIPGVVLLPLACRGPG